MVKLLALLGWGLLIFAYGFLLISTSFGWLDHMLSWSSGDWQPLKQDDNLKTVSARYTIEREMNIEGDVSGVSKVLIIECSPEISVYFDPEGKIVATRIDIASVLRDSALLELFQLLVLLAIGFILFGKREQSSSASLRSLSFLIIGFILCHLSAFLIDLYPLHLIVGSLCLFWAAFILGCVAFEYQTKRGEWEAQSPKRQRGTIPTSIHFT